MGQPTMSADELREQGRAAHDRRVWSEAFGCLAEADRAAPLAAQDLDLLADAAHLVGRDADADEYAARSFRAWVKQGKPRSAARRAAWLGIRLLLRGQEVQSSAWFARAGDILNGIDGGPDPERGFLLIPVGLAHLGAGEPAVALDTFVEVAELGARFDEPDLTAIGQLGQGQGLVAMGQVSEAMARLDEAMLTVTTGDVTPGASGIVYCAVIGECEAVFDLRRARQWTSALNRWCDTQPGLVPFRGVCLVHRAHLMQLSGEWADAADEAGNACSLLGGHPSAGEAYYRLGELHRLRGRYGDAERCFREASRWLADPQPGLALLRLAQGRVGEAALAIRRVLDDAKGDLERSRLLPAYVQIMLAANEPAAARTGATELSRTAQQFGAPLLVAMAAQAEGACALAEGDGHTSMARLRAAWAAWRDLDAPYESAQVRLLMAQAHRLLDDPGSAELELEAAGWVFDHLGAAPDLARVRTLSSHGSPAGPLTGREVEVLRLVATGMTNRAIAADLFLSEKTVARHLSNIFTKLGVSSRAAATAYAYRQGLA
jgi:DNA-binding CsgD family transcriptional regulator